LSQIEKEEIITFKHCCGAGAATRYGSRIEYSFPAPTLTFNAHTKNSICVKYFKFFNVEALKHCDPVVFWIGAGAATVLFSEVDAA
jgi:hypothetical protein